MQLLHQIQAVLVTHVSNGNFRIIIIIVID